MSNKEKCLKYYYAHKEYFRERNRRWRKEHPEQKRANSKAERIKIKSKVLTYYGGGELVCVRCGYSDWRALSIDHIAGDGSDHRREDGVPSGGHMFYYWLKKNDYPKGYQTLCMNCQFVKRYENEENS